MRSLTKSIRIPHALADCFRQMRQPGGPMADYRNDNAAIVGTLLYAALFPKRHKLTAAISRLSPEDQDAIHDLAVRLLETGQSLADLVPKPATAESVLALASHPKGVQQ